MTKHAPASEFPPGSQGTISYLRYPATSASLFYQDSAAEDGPSISLAGVGSSSSNSCIFNPRIELGAGRNWIYILRYWVVGLFTNVGVSCMTISHAVVYIIAGAK
jgi:hypothetical protein